MKQNNLFLLAIVALMASGVLLKSAPAEAKPQYCYTALDACVQGCEDNYSNPLVQAGCIAGCGIGFAFC